MTHLAQGYDKIWTTWNKKKVMKSKFDTQIPLSTLDFSLCNCIYLFWLSCTYEIDDNITVSFSYFTESFHDSASIQSFEEENNYVKVSDLPHLTLGNCHIITFVRKIESKEEYVEVKMEIPAPDMQSLKIYVTETGTEVTGIYFPSWK